MRELIISNLDTDKTLNIVVISFIGIIILSNVIALFAGIIRKGFRAVLSVLVFLITFLVAPKISTFLVNNFDYGLLQKGISYLVERDIEEKARRDYMVATGEEVGDDEALLTQLMDKIYTYDPNVSDEVNFIRNAGLPQVVTDVIVLNMKEVNMDKIEADNFYDYVGKYCASRIIIAITYIAVFMMASRVLLERDEKEYRIAYLS